MKYKNLKELLKDSNEQDVNRFIAYCKKSENETDRNGKKKNLHFTKWNETILAEMYKRVEAQGLVIEGKHITLQYNGISYDYVAYKNKMLIAYPETLLDLQLVYNGDKFSFKKESGNVAYTHELKNPFEQKENDIIGGYCVIKNKRGEFLTTLTKLDFDKHKKVAKTQYIWNAWYPEMCMKTLIKKAVKVHFDDIYNEMETEDEKNYDLTKDVSEVDRLKKFIDNANLDKLNDCKEDAEKLDITQYWEAKFDKIAKI